MREAIDRRPVVDQARGVIMALGPCTPEEAWEVLVDVSQHTNRKLHAIACSIVDSTAGPDLSEEIRTGCARRSCGHRPAGRPQVRPPTTGPGPDRGAAVRAPAGG
ncbi:ANTAR domain-containing protein [Streptomyces sp. NPDC051776]|uniref:ANTAR domain-containing protein n=1 Tax=Streptomyces sp. NPDC051776 TaxID=3155414 RepID=UPI00343CE358